MMNLKKRTILQITNIVALIITIVINGLSGLRIFNGKTVGNISNNYPNLFTPAGITFSIWGVIYVFLFLFVFYQARDILKAQKEEIVSIEQIGILFVLSCVLNSLWVIIWLYEFILLSLVIILLLLIVLIFIYLRLNIALSDLNKKDKIFLWIPFSLYLGWINIATIANATVFLVSINWDGFGVAPFLWTVIILIVAMILTLAISYSRNDFILPLVTIWALIGIVIKRYSENYNLALIAIVLIVIISLNVIYILIRK